MAKDKKTIKTMLFLMIFSVIAIVILNIQFLELFRTNMIILFPVFRGQKALFLGLFLGLLSTSFFEFLSSIISYREEKSNLQFQIFRVFLNVTRFTDKRTIETYDDVVLLHNAVDRNISIILELKNNYRLIFNSKRDKFNQMLEITYKICIETFLKETYQEKQKETNLKNRIIEYLKKLLKSKNCLDIKSATNFYRDSLLRNIQNVEEKRSEVVNRMIEKMEPYQNEVEELKQFLCKVYKTSDK